MSRAESKLFKEALEADLIQSTLEWIDYLDFKSPDEVTDEDVLQGLETYEPYGKDLLKYVQNMPKKQYDRLMGRVLKQVAKDWDESPGYVDDEWSGIRVL